MKIENLLSCFNNESRKGLQEWIFLGGKRETSRHNNYLFVVHVFFLPKKTDNSRGKVSPLLPYWWVEIESIQDYHGYRQSDDNPNGKKILLF